MNIPDNRIILSNLFGKYYIKLRKTKNKNALIIDINNLLTSCEHHSQYFRTDLHFLFL